MSANAVDLSAYRRAKTKRKHLPTCGACRRPGHYYRKCRDPEAITRWNEKLHAETQRRVAQITAGFEEVTP